MAEHTHGCLKCRPEMVPDFDPADERYHERRKCGVLLQVTVDGVSVDWTAGIFEGTEGWAFVVGETNEDVHECPCRGRVEDYSLCGAPRFGRVEVSHGCPVGSLYWWRKPSHQGSHDVVVSVKDVPEVIAALEQATRAIEARNAALMVWMESLHAGAEDWKTCSGERCVQTRAALADDGKRATGGIIKPGDWYWVGEQGPELIRPGDGS